MAACWLQNRYGYISVPLMLLSLGLRWWWRHVGHLDDPVQEEVLEAQVILPCTGHEDTHND